MPSTVKAPSGRHIWKGLRDELLLNLYPLPFTTLAPTVYHVYLHPDEFEAIEPIAPRLIGELQKALTTEVEKINAGLERRSKRMLGRLLRRENPPPIEIPTAGWEIHLRADRNGELQNGQLGIVSTLAMPPRPEYGGTPTTRIVRSVVASGRRTTTSTEVAQADAQGSGTTPSARGSDTRVRARLTYDDERGPHVFAMRKDAISVGRGGSSAWVDVQIAAASKVSREHFRIRRDSSGQFFIQDVSLWGTSVDGELIPAALKGPEGVTQPGIEHPLPLRARIGMADAVVIQFEAATDS
jgi:pSer/pThr/pTyr-binding forkhead associated (FHA) protein